MSPMFLQPDSRGRLALGTVIDRERTYMVSPQPDGSMFISPVAHALTDEQLADLQADPQGFADLLVRARALSDGAPTVPVDDFFAAVDAEQARPRRTRR